MAVLKVNDITKSYGKHIVLNKVNLEIDKPGIVALVGPNGSGKTTLMNIIANILSADSGSVEVLGKPNNDVSIFYDYSYLIDNNVLYDHLTGFNHLKYVAETHKLGGDSIEKAASYLGVTHFLNKKVSDYSLGMKQQLLFTMAVINNPKLLVLDEPFNGLDPSTIIKVREILLGFVEEGKTVLLSSHNLSEVDHMTNHIVFVKNGELIEEDISIYRKGKYYLKVEDAEKIVNEFEEKNMESRGDEIVLTCEDIEFSEIMRRIMDISTIFSIRREEIGAEERYKELYEHK